MKAIIIIEPEPGVQVTLSASPVMKLGSVHRINVTRTVDKKHRIANFVLDNEFEVKALITCALTGDLHTARIEDAWRANNLGEYFHGC